MYNMKIIIWIDIPIALLQLVVQVQDLSPVRELCNYYYDWGGYSYSGMDHQGFWCPENATSTGIAACCSFNNAGM
jgi:hypothetical protein